MFPNDYIKIEKPVYIWPLIEKVSRIRPVVSLVTDRYHGYICHLNGVLVVADTIPVIYDTFPKLEDKDKVALAVTAGLSINSTLYALVHGDIESFSNVKTLPYMNFILSVLPTPKQAEGIRNDDFDAMRNYFSRINYAGGFFGELGDEQILCLMEYGLNNLAEMLTPEHGEIFSSETSRYLTNRVETARSLIKEHIAKALPAMRF